MTCEEVAQLWCMFTHSRHVVLVVWGREKINLILQGMQRVQIAVCYEVEVSGNHGDSQIHKRMIFRDFLWDRSRTDETLRNGLSSIENLMNSSRRSKSILIFKHSNIVFVFFTRVTHLQQKRGEARVWWPANYIFVSPKKFQQIFQIPRSPRQP